MILELHDVVVAVVAAHQVRLRAASDGSVPKPAACEVMLMLFCLLHSASARLHPGAQFPESRSELGSKQKACGIPLWEARFHKKKRPEQWSRLFPHVNL
ncbi:MAG: hypothetical protein DMG49_21680 [Acidobacteria bacterium]|nr:MAG: hypothetical protein DMG49_21680 [Acidobacteriota bacterium]